MTKTYSKTRILVEGAIDDRLSTLLEYVIRDPLMPHGGSITLFSMVPILVMSYRHGAKWVMTAFVNSPIQLVQGLWQSGIPPHPHGTGGLRAARLPSGLHGAGLCLPDCKAIPQPHRGVGVSALWCACCAFCSFSGYIVWKDYD